MCSLSKRFGSPCGPADCLEADLGQVTSTSCFSQPRQAGSLGFTRQCYEHLDQTVRRVVSAQLDQAAGPWSERRLLLKSVQTALALHAMPHSQRKECVWLFAMTLMCSRFCTASPHKSSRQTAVSYSVCSGSASEIVVCKRDSWLTAQQGQALSPSSSHRVPEVLHQVWFPSSRALPERYTDWQKTWVHNHPGWQVWLWSDTTNKLLVARFRHILKMQRSCIALSAH